MVWQGLYESHSLQVWIVGGISTIVELTTDTTVLLGAMHPTLLEICKGSPKCITRGYPLKSFIMQNATEKDLRAREVVSERTAKHVAAVFQAHDLQMVADKHWLWSVDEAQLAQGDSFDLLTAVAIHSQKRGDARKALWSAMGAESERHMRRNDVDPGLQDTALSFVMENMPDYEEFDKTGYIWGRPGHFPLWVTIERERMRTPLSKELVQVRNSKKAYWHQTGIWPWWIYHESELLYWLPHNGHDKSSGYSGDQHHPK